MTVHLLCDKDYVIEILKSYKELKIEICRLEYVLKNYKERYAMCKSSGFISSCELKEQVSTSPSNFCFAEKIIDYQDKIENIKIKIAEKQDKISKIDYALSELTSEEQKIIRMRYIENKPVEKIYMEAKMSRPSYYRTIGKSLDKLTHTIGSLKQYFN